MSQHTPGPWAVNRDDPLEVVMGNAQGGDALVATIEGGHAGAERARADARLIAAAPALLAACRAVLDEFPACDGKRIESVKRICRAAISRATA